MGSRWIYLALFILGLFVGRLTIGKPESKIITETKWVKGDTIRDSIPYPVPYEVIKWKDSIVERPIPTDTAALYAIWEDYHMSRKYNLDFSNDTLGIFKIDAEVYQNKLVSATSILQPNIRTIKEREVIYKVRPLQFYTMLGTSFDFRVNKIQLGVDINQKYMIGGSLIRFGDNISYTVDLGIKF